LTGGAALVALRVATGEGFGAGLDRPVRRWDGRGSFVRLADAICIIGAAVFLLLPLSAIVISGLPGLVSFPSITNPDFLAVAPDALLRQTVEHGRPGRRMAGWLKADGLKADEVDAVVAYLRTQGGTALEADAKPARWVAGDASHGMRLFESNCGGCHGSQGKGGEGPALNNKVLLAAATDTYLVETISRGRRGTAMASFLEPSPVRQALTKADIESVVAYLRSFEGGK